VNDVNLYDFFVMIAHRFVTTFQLKIQIIYERIISPVSKAEMPGPLHVKGRGINKDLQIIIEIL
jgi:hypothetical protein